MFTIQENGKVKMLDTGGDFYLEGFSPSVKLTKTDENSFSVYTRKEGLMQDVLFQWNGIAFVHQKAVSTPVISDSSIEPSVTNQTGPSSTYSTTTKPVTQIETVPSQTHDSTTENQGNSQTEAPKPKYTVNMDQEVYSQYSTIFKIHITETSGTGMTINPRQYWLEQWNGSSWIPVSLNVAEVSGVDYSIYNQFYPSGETVTISTLEGDVDPLLAGKYRMGSGDLSAEFTVSNTPDGSNPIYQVCLDQKTYPEGTKEIVMRVTETSGVGLWVDIDAYRFKKLEDNKWVQLPIDLSGNMITHYFPSGKEAVITARGDQVTSMTPGKYRIYIKDDVFAEFTITAK